MPMTPQELIANLGELPPLPQVAAQVLKLAADPDSSTDDLQKVIITDQALSAQILKIANSAMFGMVREVTTLTQAIMTLGFSTIKSVVIAASAKNLYSRGVAGLQERLMWEHALVCAIAARSYGRCLRYPHTEEVFLAGLMHDIGKSVMTMKFPERYGALIRTVYNEQGDGLAMELDTFGFDHAMVGEALLSSWNIAKGVSQSARWHHEPKEAAVDSQVLVSLVALGNYLALTQKIGIGNPLTLELATQQALEVVSLDEAGLERCTQAAIEALDKDKGLISDF